MPSVTYPTVCKAHCSLPDAPRCLIAYVHENKARIVETLYQSIPRTITGDPVFDTEFLRGSVAETADAFLSALEATTLSH